MDAGDLDRLLNPFRYDADGQLTEQGRLRDEQADIGAAPPSLVLPVVSSQPSLALEVEAFHRQGGSFAQVLSTFRETEVVVPVRDGRLLTAECGGVRWSLAFSGEAGLDAYRAARDEAADGSLSWVRVTGARLLDVAVPGTDGPAGVALDVAGDRPVLFPPVRGVVPGDAVVGADQGV